MTSNRNKIKQDLGCTEKNLHLRHRISKEGRKHARSSPHSWKLGGKEEYFLQSLCICYCQGHGNSQRTYFFPSYSHICLFSCLSIYQINTLTMYCACATEKKKQWYPYDSQVMWLRIQSPLLQGTSEPQNLSVCCGLNFWGRLGLRTPQPAPWLAICLHSQSTSKLFVL